MTRGTEIRAAVADEIRVGEGIGAGTSAREILLRVHARAVNPEGIAIVWPAPIPIEPSAALAPTNRSAPAERSDPSDRSGLGEPANRIEPSDRSGLSAPTHRSDPSDRSGLSALTHRSGPNGLYG